MNDGPASGEIGDVWLDETGGMGAGCGVGSESKAKAGERATSLRPLLPPPAPPPLLATAAAIGDVAADRLLELLLPMFGDAGGDVGKADIFGGGGVGKTRVANSSRMSPFVRQSLMTIPLMDKYALKRYRHCPHCQHNVDSRPTTTTEIEVGWVGGEWGLMIDIAASILRCRG